MLARLFVVIGGLFVVALCSLLLAPFLVDWAGYRSAFEREASRIVGQPVRVEGTAKARILPFPSVTFSNVVIDGADGIPAARIAAFSMDAELAPFLSGEILIFDMRIERPDVRVKLAENGALLWALPNSEVLGSTQIALENVNISDGRLTLERAGDEPFLFDGINGKVSAQSLSGPWRADGRFTQASTVYDAMLSTGAKEIGETLRVRLTLAPQNGFYEAAFDGRISLENNAPAYIGKLDVTAFGNTQDTNSKRQKVADIKGDFSADFSALKMTKAVLVSGPKDSPYRADGSANVFFGKEARFEVSLKGQQVSFDEPKTNTKSDRVIPGLPLANRLSVLQNIMAEIPLPQIPGQIDLSLPALVFGDTIIRNFEVKAKPAKTGWQIKRYSIELPGRTIVEGEGDLALGAEFAFGGQMTFASKQPTGLVNWLGLEVNDAIRALPNAGFSARIDVNATRQTFRDIEFRAGNAVLRGVIDRQVPTGARPQFSIQLTGENADLDVILQLNSLAAAETTALLQQDVDFAFKSTPVSGFGFQAEKLDIAAQLINGTLALDHADVTGFAGADVRLAGSFSNIADKSGSAVDLDVSAVDPVPLINVLSGRFPKQLWLKALGERAAYMGTALADTKLTAKIALDANKQAANFDYNFDGAGLRFDGKGQSLNIAEQNMTITAKGDADAGETLLAGMGVPVGDAVTALQLLEPATFEVSVEAKSGEIQSGTLNAASNNDRFVTVLGAGFQPFTLTLDDAATYTMSAGYGLPGAAFGLPLSLKGNWQKTGTTLSLQKLEGAFVDVPLSGDVALSLGKRLKLTGNISAGSIDRSVLDEIVFGSLAASGDSQTEFSGNISLPFDADMNLTVDEATGFAPRPLTKANGRIVASQNSVRFAELKAEIIGGKITGSAELRKNGPEALISFNAVIADADLSKIYGADVTGKSNLQIELSATGSNLESLRSSTVGSGIVTSRDAIINGVSSGGLKGLIEEADSRESAPDTIATLEMATRKFISGKMILPEFQSAFTVTSGIARAPRSLLKIEGGTLAVEPKIDLNSGEADIGVQLLFDAGIDALTGTDPALNLNLKGPWSNMALTIDPQPLQGFLAQRALEREEIRVEAIQSALLEKQRLRRENRYYASLIKAREKAETDRLAEIERLAKEAAKAEREKLEKERLDKERIKAEKLKAEAGDQIPAPTETPANDPAINPANVPADLPLNLDGLLKELEIVPPVQP
jgi:AsmA-like C-terminal region